MATLDLTLSELRLAGLTNFTPDFGTKEADGVSVSTENVCKDFMLPFKLQRPLFVSESSDTSNIEAHRTLVLANIGIVLTLGQATFAGCTISVLTSFPSGSAQVRYLIAKDTYESVTLMAGDTLELMSNSSLFFEKKLQISNTIITNVDDNIVQNRRYLYPSVFPLTDRNRDTDFVVQNNSSFSKFSVYIRAGATLPPFYVKGVGLLRYHTEIDQALDFSYLDKTCNRDFEAGKDYFVYLIYSPVLFPNLKNNLGFRISLNDPDGISLYGNSDISGTGAKPLKAHAEVDGVTLTEDNCMCVGGFHTVLAKCSKLYSGAQPHPFTGFDAGAIHPFSVWDLFHRSESTSVGMTYVPTIGKWASIYLLSERGLNKKGETPNYGGAYPRNNIILMSAANQRAVVGGNGSFASYSPATFSCLRGEQILSFQKQRFPTSQEAVAITLGSPQNAEINSNQLATEVMQGRSLRTGSHTVKDGTQILSYSGIYDSVSVLWQWESNNVFCGSFPQDGLDNNYNQNDSDVGGTSSKNFYRILFGGCVINSSSNGSRSEILVHQTSNGGSSEDFLKCAFRAISEPRHFTC